MVSYWLESDLAGQLPKDRPQEGVRAARRDESQGAPTTIDDVAESSKALAPRPRDARQPSDILVLACSLLLLAAVGWVDYVTGVELRVFPLYFLPLTFVSLRFRRPAALAFTLRAPRPGSDPTTWRAWQRRAGRSSLANAAIMLVAFVFVTILAAKHRTSLERERILSRTDSLTGLPNSRGFYEAAGAEVVRSGRYRHPVTLAYLDIDDFKEINDRFGHARGDELLVAVARALRSASRSSDLVGRLGGDEFVDPLSRDRTRCGRRGATEAPGASPGFLEGRRLACADGQHRCRFATPCRPRTSRPLVRQADALMYEVKTSGKNGVRSVEGASDPS